MKKIFTLLFLTFYYGMTAQTGCLEAVNGQQPYGQYTVTCNNNFQNITTVARAGTFSTVEIYEGRIYTFKSSIATDFLTLSNEAGTEAIVSGTGSVVIAPTADQVIRFYIHSNEQCGSPTTFRTKSVKCDPGPDPNDPAEPVEGCLSEPWSNAIIYTPFCNGANELITDFAFTGSYSPVQVTANTAYTFKSSVPTDHITLANGLGTAIIRTGTGEVTWTAVADGEIQFQIYLDENCGAGDYTEEPRALTIQCGEQLPPSEGCLSAPNGQAPFTIFVPTCNTTVESVVPMGQAGQYSMVQVTASTPYTFYSSISTDMITIGNEEGTEVLGYGFGTFDWTPDADRLVRFYTHANESCALDIQTRTRAVKCGNPFVATEPDFDCFQGAGLASNNFEEGYSISEESFSVADDFVVDGEFIVQQVRLNLLSIDEIQTISLNFLADNNTMPGSVSQTALNIVPTEQLVIGAKNGFLVYQVTVDLPNPLTFSTGKYWLQPSANSMFGSYWEMTSTGSSHATAQTLSPENDWLATNLQAVFFISGECSNLSTGEFNLSKISFSPNPVKDVLSFSATLEIEKITVFSISGQLLKEQKPLNGKLDVSDLKTGLYLFKAELKSGASETFKIIKE